MTDREDDPWVEARAIRGGFRWLALAWLVCVAFWVWLITWWLL